jgi:hypothetical protein
VKKIRINREDPHFPGDVERIVGVFADRGLEVTRGQAEDLWRMNSESFCAGWLCLPEMNEVLFQDLEPYYTVIEEST